MNKLCIFAAAALSFLLSCSGEPTLDLVGMVDGQSPDANARIGSDGGVEMLTVSAPIAVISPTADYKV